MSCATKKEPRIGPHHLREERVGSSQLPAPVGGSRLRIERDDQAGPGLHHHLGRWNQAAFRPVEEVPVRHLDAEDAVGLAQHGNVETPAQLQVQAVEYFRRRTAGRV